MSLSIDERVEIHEFIAHLCTIKPNKFEWSVTEHRAYDLMRLLISNDDKRVLKE